jgi:two-component system chemotaxis response regulator CheY
MGKKIIVVDDSRTARLIAARTLKGAGYEVVEAADGVDGMRKIEAHADAALVLCDVNMPNLGGIDMVEAVRKAGRSSSMTFVMLTTEAEPELVQRAKACGAKGWIVKPFKPELLLGAVLKLVGPA